VGAFWATETVGVCRSTAFVYHENFELLCHNSEEKAINLQPWRLFLLTKK